jgi:hypothetical protein
MRIVLVLSISLLTSISSFAHEYFFGFAEIAYNPTEQAIEGTLILSTHDVEEWLQGRNIPVKELEDHVSDKKIIQQMASALFSELEIKNNGNVLSIRIIGYEVLPSGMTNFYFHSNKTQKPTRLDFKFNLMMKELPQQQNKITYLDNEKSYTAVFTDSNKQSSILIE